MLTTPERYTWLDASDDTSMKVGLPGGNPVLLTSSAILNAVSGVNLDD